MISVLTQAISSPFSKYFWRLLRVSDPDLSLNVNDPWDKLISGDFNMKLNKILYLRWITLIEKKNLLLMLFKEEEALLGNDDSQRWGAKSWLANLDVKKKRVFIALLRKNWFSEWKLRGFKSGILPLKWIEIDRFIDIYFTKFSIFSFLRKRCKLSIVWILAWTLFLWWSQSMLMWSDKKDLKDSLNSPQTSDFNEEMWVYPVRDTDLTIAKRISDRPENNDALIDAIMLQTTKMMDMVSAQGKVRFKAPVQNMPSENSTTLLSKVNLPSATSENTIFTVMSNPQPDAKKKSLSSTNRVIWYTNDEAIPYPFPILSPLINHEVFNLRELLENVEHKIFWWSQSDTVEEMRKFTSVFNLGKIQQNKQETLWQFLWPDFDFTPFQTAVWVWESEARPKIGDGQIIWLMQVGLNTARTHWIWNELVYASIRKLLGLNPKEIGDVSEELTDKRVRKLLKMPQMNLKYWTLELCFIAEQFYVRWIKSENPYRDILFAYNAWLQYVLAIYTIEKAMQEGKDNAVHVKYWDNTMEFSWLQAFRNNMESISPGITSSMNSELFYSIFDHFIVAKSERMKRNDKTSETISHYIRTMSIYYQLSMPIKWKNDKGLNDFLEFARKIEWPRKLKDFTLQYLKKPLILAKK